MIEKKTTHFFRTRDSVKRKRVNKKWRRPRGIHNKQRQSFKGNLVNVSIGYRMPAELRGLNRNGLMVRRVSTLAELQKIDKKADIMVVASVGKKRKIELLKKAKELGITVQNIKVDDYLARIEQEIKAKKEQKTEAQKKKEEKQKEKEKKAKEKEKESKQEKTEEEKKTEEKKVKEEIMKQGL